MTQIIKSPALKYYGGKFRLAPWIINHFPEHQYYVEPFGGGASVLLQKPAAKIETYNDLDGDVVNFFRCLRERTDELIRLIELTPWARSEYEHCLTNSGEFMEDARRLFVRLYQSIHGGTIATKTAWRRGKPTKQPKAPMKYFRAENLFAVAERLKQVQIENRDAFRLLFEMDSPETLFYIDPPYPASTRTDKKRYTFEISDQEHRKLAIIAGCLKAHVVISGYPCELYKSLFEDKGWKRIDKQTTAGGGAKRTECLWLSPRTAVALGV